MLITPRRWIILDTVLLGSIYSNLFKRSDQERRLLVLIGMAAELSAIFRSPIGTAIFAMEVLYGNMEFEGAALPYTMLGSLVAHVVNGLFVGAMVGGLMAKLFHQPSAAFVVVGMAVVFGGAARVPIATLLMVTEMTGGHQLLVPAAVATMLSYLVQKLLSSRLKYTSL